MRNIGAVILAAGGSSRFGRPKQLLAFRGESLVRRAVRAATEARCRRVAVVVGDDSDRIEAELRETASTVVENRDWKQGLGTSVRCGVQHLLDAQSDLDAVVMLVCDQPFVEASVITSLIARWENSGQPIVASGYADSLGVPALFDRSCFEALLALPADSGAKALIESRSADVAHIEFEKGAIDIDNPADLEQITTER